MIPFSRLVRASVRQLVRAACVLSLVGLAVLAYSILVPGPLPIIFAMSAGHAIGGLAFACYVLAVVVDAAETKRERWIAGRSSAPPPSHPGT